MKAMLEPRMVAAKTHLPFGAWGSLESGPADVILIRMDTVRCGHDIRRCHSSSIWSTGTLEAPVHASRVVGNTHWQSSPHLWSSSRRGNDVAQCAREPFLRIMSPPRHRLHCFLRDARNYLTRHLCC